MNGTATRTTDETGAPTILQRIAAGTRPPSKNASIPTAISSGLWQENSPARAKKSEAATEEIFNDIWRYCDSARNAQSSEEKLIAMIALRRLIKSSRQVKPMSMASLDATNEQGAETGGVSKHD